MATENPPNLTAGWRATGSGNADQASVPLTSGFIIERRAAATNMKLTPVYGDL